MATVHAGEAKKFCAAEYVGGVSEGKMYLTTFLAGSIAVVNHATGPWNILGLADTMYPVRK